MSKLIFSASSKESENLPVTKKVENSEENAQVAEPFRTILWEARNEAIVFQVRLKKDTAEYLDAFCKKHDIDRSKAIRLALANFDWEGYKK